MSHNDDPYTYWYHCRCGSTWEASFTVLGDAIDALNYCQNVHKKSCSKTPRRNEVIYNPTNEVAFKW